MMMKPINYNLLSFNIRKINLNNMVQHILNEQFIFEYIFFISLNVLSCLICVVNETMTCYT
jgi:hypothetical protein